MAKINLRVSVYGRTKTPAVEMQRTIEVPLAERFDDLNLGPTVGEIRIESIDPVTIRLEPIALPFESDHQIVQFRDKMEVDGWHEAAPKQAFAKRTDEVG